MSDETQETLRTSTFPSGGDRNTARRRPVPLPACLPADVQPCARHLDPALSRFPLAPMFAAVLTAWPCPLVPPACTSCLLPCPAEHVKEKWAKDLYIAGIAYGRTVT